MAWLRGIFAEKTEKYEKLGSDDETKKINNFSNISKDNENTLVQNVYLKEKALNTSKTFQLFSLIEKGENKEIKIEKEKNEEKEKEKRRSNIIKLNNKKSPDKKIKESLIYNKPDKNNKINNISNIDRLSSDKDNEDEESEKKFQNQR